MAKEFKTLMDKNEDTITKENGCKFMFLYKQRIFEDLLIENVFDGNERRNFLIALTTALEEVSVELLCIHIQTVSHYNLLIINKIILFNFIYSFCVINF